MLVQLLQPSQDSRAFRAAAACRPWSRNGSEEATKSTSRAGSSMFAAMVRSSSDKRGRLGDDLLELANHVAHQRFDAGRGLRGSMSSSVSTSATMNGSVWTKRSSRTRSTPSVKQSGSGWACAQPCAPWPGCRLCADRPAWARPAAGRAAPRPQSCAPRPATRSTGWSSPAQP